MRAQVHMHVHTCVCTSLLHVSFLIPATISLLPTCLVPYLTFLLEVVFMPGHHYHSHGDRGSMGGKHLLPGMQEPLLKPPSHLRGLCSSSLCSLSPIDLFLMEKQWIWMGS